MVMNFELAHTATCTHREGQASCYIIPMCHATRHSMSYTPSFWKTVRNGGDLLDTRWQVQNGRTSLLASSSVDRVCPS